MPLTLTVTTMESVNVTKTGELTAVIITADSATAIVSPALDQMKTNVSHAPAMVFSPAPHALVKTDGLDVDVISMLVPATSYVSDVSAQPNGTVLNVLQTPPCQPRTVDVSVCQDGMETVVLIRSTHATTHVLPAPTTLKVVLMSAQPAGPDTTSVIPLVDTAGHATLAVQLAQVPRQLARRAIVAST